MSGKPQVSPSRLANMLDVLSSRPGFKGKVYLQPDGGIQVDTTIPSKAPSDGDKALPDLTDEELATFGRIK